MDLDAGDGPGGGQDEGAGWFSVSDVDGDRGVGDVGGDRAASGASADETYWPAIMTRPESETRRWTVTGSIEGRGRGPAGRAPWSRRAWPGVSGFGRGCGCPAGQALPVAAERRTTAAPRAGCPRGSRPGTQGVPAAASPGTNNHYTHRDCGVRCAPCSRPLDPAVASGPSARDQRW